MEDAGAIFIPVAGAYSILEITERGERGCYWSSTSAGDEEHKYLYRMSTTSGKGYASSSETYCVTRSGRYVWLEI